MTRACKVCSVEKPLTDYYKDPCGADGHRLTCIACFLAERKAHRDQEISVGPHLPPEPRTSALYFLLQEDESWKDSAACADAAAEAGTYDDYFPENGASLVKFTQCANCPVAFDCLEYSDRINAQGGLWGGMSGDARRRFLNLHDTKDPRTRGVHAAYLKTLRIQADKKLRKASA